MAKKQIRILPYSISDVRQDTRVKILGEDDSGFVIVEADIKDSESVCWRCGLIAKDPDHTLEICPVCEMDFND